MVSKISNELLVSEISESMTDMRSTSDAGGPILHISMTMLTLSESPVKCASTSPVFKFLTHPEIPFLTDVTCNQYLNPTPWTLPNILIFLHN